MGATNWPNEDELALTELWKGNLSAAQMIEFLPGKTRNAILGKAHRMGLPSKQAGAKLGRPKPRKPIVVKTPIRIKPQPRFIATPIEPWVPFMASRGSTCRAIMVDHGVDDLAMFCSNTKDVEASFCHYHADIFYQKRSS